MSLLNRRRIVGSRRTLKQGFKGSAPFNFRPILGPVLLSAVSVGAVCFVIPELDTRY
jgi:hypothetical protein